MYVVGLIDDENSQLSRIRRTIKTNAPEDIKCEFKEYLIKNVQDNLVEKMFCEVMTDIVEHKISSLIVDYKIMSKTIKIEGTEIFKKINNEVPKFPIIILTERVEDSMQPTFVDADKVYKKKDFYKLETEYSKEKVFNIFDSMKKYVIQRDELELTIQGLKRSLNRGCVGREAVNSILFLENQLNSFVPTEQTQIDKVFDEEKVKNIVEMIEKANKLME